MSTNLRLATSFKDEDYPYLVTIHPGLQSQIFGKNYFDGHSGVPYGAIRGKILHSLNLAEIRDYKMFDANGRIQVHLPSEKTFQDFAFAYGPDEERAYSVEASLRDIPRRTLRKKLKHAADVLDRTALRNRFYIVANITENRLSVATLDKTAYFEMQRASPERYILDI